ncbi:E3 ubiquitin-protein ligase CBL-C [Pholidichthys leucotaenia]
MEAAGLDSSRSPRLSSQQPNRGDLRLVDKTLKRLARLHELCTNPQLGLRNSPPHLPQLVSETSALLSQVWEPYQSSKAAGSRVPHGDEAEYLRIHIKNLLDKTDRAVLLFKEGRRKIFDKTSSYRRNLTKLTLLFSHILWELKAIFPRGCFHGDKYKVTMAEADEFWRHSFDNRSIVQWNRFKEKLQSVHSFEEGMEAMALKSTIDLTCNDHISVFEFDIFTRLFQPWKSLIMNWNQLAVTHPGYMAFLTYDQVKSRLEHYLHKPGSYIFRLSCTRMGEWAIGHVTFEGKIIQTIPEKLSLFQALILGFEQGCYLYPDGRDVNPDLSSFCEPAQRGKVKITKEQYELYCEIGSTYQLCKICTDRDKDTRIQPCGHLMCEICLTGWQLKSSGQTCPYCRCEIKGTESILMEPFEPVSDQSVELGNNDSTDEDPEDHEDIEMLVKEIGALKKVSSLDYQTPRPHSSVPPLPPKITTALRSPPPPNLAQTSETKIPARHSNSDSGPSGAETHRHKQQTNRSQAKGAHTSEEVSFSSLRPRPLSHSVEHLRLPSSSQKNVNGGAAWVDPSGPVKDRRHKEKEESRAGPRKEKLYQGEIKRTMSS